MNAKYVCEKILNIIYHQGIEIKVIMKYHYTLIKKAKIKKTNES